MTHETDVAIFIENAVEAILKLMPFTHDTWSRENFQCFVFRKTYPVFESISQKYDCVPAFRVAESPPFFYISSTQERLLEACEIINKDNLSENIKELTQVPLIQNVTSFPNEDDRTIFYKWISVYVWMKIMILYLCW